MSQPLSGKYHTIVLWMTFSFGERRQGHPRLMARSPSHSTANCQSLNVAIAQQQFRQVSAYHLSSNEANPTLIQYHGNSSRHMLPEISVTVYWLSTVSNVTDLASLSAVWQVTGIHNLWFEIKSLYKYKLDVRKSSWNTDEWHATQTE